MMHAIKRPGGEVSILELLPGNQGIKREIDAWETNDLNICLSHRDLAVETVLPDGYFRSAWTDDNPTDTVDVDMPRAREIHMQKLRFMRNVKLKELDIETMKGIDVQSEKQVLRDLPENTDLSVATTPEELKAIMPSELS